jgi:hypothetical protein
MISVLALVGSVALLGAVEEPAASDGTRKAYEAKRVETGRDAEAHVKLAEWCEKNGLTTEKAKHLRMAILLDPKNDRARELLGMPTLSQRQAAQEAAAAEALAEYNELRDQAPKTASGHAALARWCEKHGLDAEAKMHWSEVTRLAPRHAEAWQRLGFVKYGGRWVKADVVRQIEDQRTANKEWAGRLRLLHMDLHDPPRRQWAEQELDAVRDPRAVPAIYHEFASGRGDEQVMAVRILGHIRSRASSQALAALAVFGASPGVRSRAVTALRDRDPVDYVGGMLGLLTDPVRYRVTPVGRDGAPGSLIVEGEKVDVKRIYAPPQLSAGPAQAGEFVAVDPDAGAANPWPPDVIGPIAGRLGQAGLPGENALATLSPVGMANLQAAAAFEARLEGDVRLLEAINAGRVALAHYVLSLARDATGQDDLDDDPRTWRDWLAKQAGRSVADRPEKETVVVMNPPPAFLPRPPVPR